LLFANIDTELLPYFNLTLPQLPIQLPQTYIIILPEIAVWLLQVMGGVAAVLVGHQACNS